MVGIEIKGHWELYMSTDFMPHSSTPSVVECVCVGGGGWGGGGT